MPVASVFRPIAPPIASISLTMWPLPNPPTAGLHDICPMVSRFWVNIKVRQPTRAAARAASIPACPLPMTTTSYSVGSLNIAKSLHNALSRPGKQIGQNVLLTPAAQCRRHNLNRRIEFGEHLAAGTAGQGWFVGINDDGNRDKTFFAGSDCAGDGRPLGTDS